MVYYLIGIILITYFINRITLNSGFKDLTYGMNIDKRVAEINEEVQFQTIVENNKPLTVSFLNIKERFPKGLSRSENNYVLFIMPYQRVKRSYMISGYKRGLYSIDDTELELGDFIGFKTIKEKVKTNTELTVLPKRAILEDNIQVVGSFTGDISVKRWIIDDPLMTIGIREYTGNEPERYIHWPSSIRHGNLMVKNFDFTTDNSVMVVLNVETTLPSWKPPEEEIIEKSISICRTLLEDFEDIKIPYGFASNAYNRDNNSRMGHFYHPGLGENQLNNLLEVLGKIDYRVPTSFNNILTHMASKRVNFTTLVIITPRILDSYIEPLNKLSKNISQMVLISLEEEKLDKLNKNIIKYKGV